MELKAYLNYLQSNEESIIPLLKKGSFILFFCIYWTNY